MEEIKELPEAKDPFEKRVALSIAIIAVVFATFSTYGDHAKTSAIILTNQASDQWAFYQAKSIKEHLTETETKLMKAITKEPEISKEINTGAQKKYEEELKEIKQKAEELTEEARHETIITQRSDIATLIMQVSIVLCSISILSRWKRIWHIGIFTALIGIAFGVFSLFL
jgi:vacuolar-type H+-ATPase subunit H